MNIKPDSATINPTQDMTHPSTHTYQFL